MLAGCASSDTGQDAPRDPGHAVVRMHGVVKRDSVRFELPLAVNQCGSGRGLLFHGAARGQGILAWVRAAGAIDTGSYPLLTRGDSVTPRGATVAIRYVTADISHGLIVDNGLLQIAAARPPISARVRGVGLEPKEAEQFEVEITVSGVVSMGDTVTCRAQP